MTADWEKLQADLAALKAAVAQMRATCAELDLSEIESLLAPVRGCTVELIALRSSLEKIRLGRTGDDADR